MDIAGIESTSGIGNPSESNVAINLKANQNKTDSFQTALDSAMQNKDKAALKKACTSFESYFIQMMFKQMRSTIPKDEGFLPKDQAESTFQEMLDEEYSKSAASGKGIGLADMMYKQMSKNIDNA